MSSDFNRKEATGFVIIVILFAILFLLLTYRICSSLGI